MNENKKYLLELHSYANEILRPLVDSCHICHKKIKWSKDDSESPVSIAWDAVQNMLEICNNVITLLNTEYDNKSDTPSILGYTLAANSIIVTYFLNHATIADALQFKYRYFSQEMFNGSYTIDSLNDGMTKEIATKSILRIYNVNDSYYSSDKDLYMRYDLRLLADYNIKHFKEEYIEADNNNKHEMKETMLLALNMSKLTKLILLNGERIINFMPSCLFITAKKKSENMELLKSCILLSGNALYWLYIHYKIKAMIKDDIIDNAISIVEDIINKLAAEVIFPD